jgi:hypothetical protein
MATRINATLRSLLALNVRLTAVFTKYRQLGTLACLAAILAATLEH